MVGAIIEAIEAHEHERGQDEFRSKLKDTIERLGVVIRMTLNMFEDEVVFAVIATRQQLEEIARIDEINRIRPDVAVTVRKSRDMADNRS